MKAIISLTWFSLFLLNIQVGFEPNQGFHEEESGFLMRTFNDPMIQGPDQLCNVFGSVLGTFSGGGDPETDVYQWTILGPSDQILFNRTGGFEEISYTFGLLGSHKIQLIVNRGGIQIYEEEKVIEVLKGPDITLNPSYQICNGQVLTVEAISPSSENFSEYEFEWRDESGTIIGNENSLDISSIGKYEVTFFFPNSSGNPECTTTVETEVKELPSVSIQASKTNLCPGESINFTTDPLISGDWYIQKSGTSTPTKIGTGNSITVSGGGAINEPGDYEIIFRVENPNNPSCSPEDTETITFNFLPSIELVEAFGSSGCFIPDGALQVRALTDLDFISIEGLGQGQGPFNSGDIIDFTGLESGAYSLVSQLNGCVSLFGTVVPLSDPPPGLEFEIENIEPEICTETGKTLGSFIFRMINGPLEGSYRLLNFRGEEIFTRSASGLESEKIEIGGGKYFFEVFNEDSCKLPKREEFEVPGLNQVNFNIPANLNICQSYDLIPSSSQNLEYTLILPDGSEVTKAANEPFTLTEAGEYSMVGRLAGQGDLCPLLKTFNVTLVDPVDFEPKLIDQDCFGNMTYEADINGRDPSTVKFRWFDENDQLVGTGQFLNPTSFGNFKLDVQPANSQACPIPPVEFEIKEPILEVEVSLESTKLCEYGPRAILDLSSTFPEEITDIEWRRYDFDGNIEDLPQFTNQTQIIVDAEGVYEAAVFSRIPSINKDCELGRSTLRVDLIPDKVPFDIPGDLSICDPYELIPDNNGNLEFLLTFPDGKEEIKSTGEAFTLDQEGEYILLGYDTDISGPLCPEQKIFNVRINPPVEFEPILINLDCNGVYEYQADVSNYLADQVDYFWRNANGDLLSTEQTFLSDQYGDFTLEVQPSGSIACNINPKEFNLPQPVLSIPTEIIAETLCPDQPDAALRLEADLEQVQTIEWWFTDLSNNTSQLNQNNKTEILAIEEGNYEVRLYNRFGCVIGRDENFVIRSTDQFRPEVKDSYKICPRLDLGPQINPGNFASYEWYFDGQVVSTASTFKPSQIGQYDLVVTSAEGCAYATSFVTEEECELRVQFPTAITPEDPEKPFLIYTNYLVDELELWIFNQWGELIFHCQNTELITEESTCIWDGYYRRKKVPNGAYSIRIDLVNYEKNIHKTQFGSLMVID
ncbi:gliding motility-associated C-terminal domain-containing protein [Algoriphagus limi]|uniref:Gliding motility-associated C-terminal domain-containing protein n=1 Tax=Algoriphagus limi TaxID=2975273 RepID=A0ABT2G919_9BACT|nr:gliding motility-associated C-terminal domain-containing protein [Algoriphagus limi]MCS5491699.1 gliding motility-associated C-terminal domain-containing protein [Algoriphagus limi]